jgi:hypothetical protein
MANKRFTARENIRCCFYLKSFTFEPSNIFLQIATRIIEIRGLAQTDMFILTTTLRQAVKVLRSRRVKREAAHSRAISDEFKKMCPVHLDFHTRLHVAVLL